jgi:hypothetical protein
MEQEGVMMQEGQVAQQYPQAPPAAPAPQPPQPSSWSLSWESDKQVKVAKIGLILMIVGVIITRVIFPFAGFNLPSELINVLNIAGIVLLYIGMLLLILPLLMIAMYDKELHHHVRVAIVVAVGLILAFGF